MVLKLQEKGRKWAAKENFKMEKKWEEEGRKELKKVRWKKYEDVLLNMD
jgi:hypothetical protein